MRKVLALVVLFALFAIQATPVLAETETYHSNDKSAFGFGLVEGGLFRVLADKECAIIWYWEWGTWWPTIRVISLEKGDFKWSMAHATLETEALEDALIIEWDTAGHTETVNWNYEYDWWGCSYHVVCNGMGKCAAITVTLNDEIIGCGYGFVSHSVENWIVDCPNCPE